MEEDARAYIALAESINPEIFGPLVGAGSQSLAIKPYMEWNGCMSINDPVMIITLESEKFELLENLFKGTTAKVERVDYNELGEEYSETISYLKDEGWDIFYASKMQQFDLSESRVIDVFMELQDNFNQCYYDASSLPADYIMDELKYAFTQEKDQEEFSEEESRIIMAIEHSFKAVKNMNSTSKFLMDVHSEQFGEVNGQLFCLDPVLFNTEFLQR